MNDTTMQSLHVQGENAPRLKVLPGGSSEGNALPQTTANLCSFQLDTDYINRAVK